MIESTVRPIPGVSVVVWHAGRVLLVERGKGATSGLWSPPGGHVEPGERAIDAARREVEEETGIVAQIGDLLGISDVVIRDGKGSLQAHYMLAVFHGTWLAGEPRAGSDARSVRFFGADELAGLALVEGAAGFIAKARHMLGD